MSRRIALISDHASPLATLGGVDAGGQNVYVAHVARQLAAGGHRVDIFTRREDPSLPDIAPMAPGVRVVHVDAGPAEPIRKEELLEHMPAFRDAMLRHVAAAKRPYHIVHANFWLSGLVAAELKERLGLPFVVTFHALGRVRRQFQGADDGFPDERFEIEDRIVREADAIIAECPQDEEDLIRLYNADPARISIIPAGFDPDEFAPMSRPLARLGLGLDPAERILLQLGRMVPRKGVDNVIRALGRLEREHELRARLLVVGGADRVPDPERTPELGRLAAIADEEGVRDSVTFVGRRDRSELAEYYNAADIFISTPWYEPFGITPLEAMGCGTPVVGSNVGGIKFSVRDGETGYLVPPNDPSALAERIAHLYAHPKLMALFGRQGVQRVRDLFTWDRVAAGIAALYEEVLAAGRWSRREETERLDTIDARFDGAIAVLQASKQRLRSQIADAADLMTATFARDRQLLIAGNGGSAAEAQHFAAEFVGRFKVPGRPALPAIALGRDVAVLTAWSNDADYDLAFAREVEAIGRPGDLLIGLSTSGRSRNLVHAFEAARARGLRTLALLGGNGGDLRDLADLALVVPSADTQHIQEVHGLMIHVLTEIVERRLADAGSFATASVAADGTGAWREKGRPTPIPISTRRSRSARTAAVGR